MNLRRAAVPLLVLSIGLALLFALASLRVHAEGRAEMAVAREAWTKGDAREATVHARRAASAFVVGSRHADEGYALLREIAEQTELKGDPDGALFAWRAVRAAALGSRSWLTSHEAERRAADASIARLSALVPAASLKDKAGPVAESSRRYRAALEGESGVPLGFSVLVLAGAALWVVGAIVVARRGLDLEGNLRPRELRTGVLLTVLGLGLWMAGLFAH